MEKVFDLIDDENEDELDDFLDENPDAIKAKNSNQLTPLLFAAEVGSEPIIEILFDYDANPEDETDNEENALHIAVKSDNDEIIDILISNGVDKTAFTEDGLNALHIAAQNGYAKCVQALIKHKVDIEELSDDGMNALHYAAEKGFVDVIKILLAAGANKDAKGDNGTALQIAQKNNKVEVIKLLEPKKADPITPKANKSMSSESSEESSNEKESNTGNDKLNSKFEQSESSTDSEKTEENRNISNEKIMETGTNQKFDSDAETESEEESSLSKEAQVRVVKKIKSSENSSEEDSSSYEEEYSSTSTSTEKVDQKQINQSEQNSTPNKIPSGSIRKNFAQLLLKPVGENPLSPKKQNKPKIDEKNQEEIKLFEEGKLLLIEFKDTSKKNKTPFTKFLKEKKNAAKLTDSDGDTFMHVAAKNGFDTVLEVIKSAGADTKAKNNKGQTILHAACQSGNYKTILQALSYWPDVNAIDDEGNTALHIAAMKFGGMEGPKVKWELAQITKAIAGRGFKFNIQNREGNTVLHEAVLAENIEAVGFLWRRAKNELKNADGKTPRNLAKESSVDLLSVMK